MLWFLLFLPCVTCDVVIKTIFLVAYDAFAITPYRDILQTHFGPTTIDSVQPDTITGAQVRSSYFPNRTDIYQFQLLHITRVQASIVTTNTSAWIQQLLPDLCTGIGPVAIVVDPPASNNLIDTLLSLIPPIVAPIALGGWLLTIVLCGACWLVFLCHRQPVIPAAVVTQSSGQRGQYAELKTALGPAAVRLVLSNAGQVSTRT